MVFITSSDRPLKMLLYLSSTGIKKVCHQGLQCYLFGREWVFHDWIRQWVLKSNATPCSWSFCMQMVFFPPHHIVTYPGVPCQDASISFLKTSATVVMSKSNFSIISPFELFCWSNPELTKALVLFSCLGIYLPLQLPSKLLLKTSQA